MLQLQDVGAHAIPHAGRIDIGDVDVGDLGDSKGCEPGIGDVDEGVEAGAHRRHDKAAEGGEIVGPGIAGGDAGRHALMAAELVGRGADRRAVGIDMRVQVDKAGCDELA
jgi:hypothetical protein